MYQSVSDVIRGVPFASAYIRGNKFAPYLNGTMKLYPWANGTIVKLEIINLPDKPTPFAVHIHDGKRCDPDDFSGAGGHYNPTNVEHPAHAGDLPSIFSNDGYSYMVTYTNRFKPKDLLGKPVIIHLDPDDFRTQPSGNAGKRIGCGIFI